MRLIWARHRQRIIQGVLILVGLLALVFWLRSFDVAGTLQLLVQANFWWVIAFIIGHGFMVTLRALRWRSIISPLCPLPMRVAGEIFFLGEFLNASFAMRSGDVAKAAMLRQQAGLSVFSGLSLLLADKLFELWGLISITGLALAIVFATNESVGGISVPVLVFYPVLMVVIVAIALVIATDRAMTVFRGIAERTDFFGRVGGMVYHVAVGLRAAAQMGPRKLIGLGLLSSFIYLVDGLSVVLLFWAVGAEVSAGKVLLGACMVALIFLIPVPGNIGTLEAGFALFFGQLNVASAEQINAVAILFHAGLYLGLLVLAIGSLRRYRALMRSGQAPGGGAAGRKPDLQRRAATLTPTAGLGSRDSSFGTSS